MKNLKVLYRRTFISILCALTLVLTLTGCQDILNNLEIYIQTSDDQTTLYDWSEEKAPNYYSVIGEAEIESQTKLLKEGTYEIELDELNRPSIVRAKINDKMRQDGAARERDDLPNPLGWPKNKQVTINFADGTTYHGWLFNRSHLLAKSLGGPDTKENLVTGTRTQNVGKNDGDGGIAYTEELARNWLDDTDDGYVLYEVEPIYVNDEVIPRTVNVDILTSDHSIDEHVITYNAAKGFEINYATSEWKEVN